MPYCDWRLSAGIGVGDVWHENANSIQEDCTRKIDNLRKRVIELNGQLTLLNQPTTTLKRLPAWFDANSKPLIEAVKSQFDPKGQLALGRLPGIRG